MVYLFIIVLKLLSLLLGYGTPDLTSTRWVSKVGLAWDVANVLIMRV